MFENTFQGPGAGTYMNYTWEILIMLLVAFILGVLLGFILWSRYRRMHAELQSDYDRLNAQHSDLEKDHASLRYQAEELEKDNKNQRAKVMNLNADVAILNGKLKACQEQLDAATGGSGKKAATGAAATPPPKPDDLRKIEGIGPKIEKLINDMGVWTYRQLADTSVEDLQKMLDDAGPAYRITDPGTWPEQAKMAADGKWDELNELQGRLKGGKSD
ncbi:MAG: hypothetical protein ACE5FF_00790 [Saprospiraceae bacterium]